MTPLYKVEMAPAWRRRQSEQSKRVDTLPDRLLMTGEAAAGSVGSNPSRHSRSETHSDKIGSRSEPAGSRHSVIAEPASG